MRNSIKTGTLWGFEFETDGPFRILWTVDIEYRLEGVNSLDGQWDGSLTWKIARLVNGFMVSDYKLCGHAIELFNHQHSWTADDFTERFHWLKRALEKEINGDELEEAIAANNLQLEDE